MPYRQLLRLRERRTNIYNLNIVYLWNNRSHPNEMHAPHHISGYTQSHSQFNRHVRTIVTHTICMSWRRLASPIAYMLENNMKASYTCCCRSAVLLMSCVCVRTDNAHRSNCGWRLFGPTELFSYQEQCTLNTHIQRSLWYTCAHT